LKDFDAVLPAPTLLAPHARRIQQKRGSLPPTGGASAWGGPAPTFGSIHDFPRGTRAGSCLHALFERIDFQQRAAPVGSVAAAVLEEFGYALEWRPVLERLVADVLATPLNAAGLKLAGFVSYKGKVDRSALERVHGGPARIVIPRYYFWKSAKWVTRIELLAEDRPGFWEVRGYHNNADPWLEERYG